MDNYYIFVYSIIDEELDEDFNKAFTRFLFEILAENPHSFIKNVILFNYKGDFEELDKKLVYFFKSSEYKKYVKYVICNISISNDQIRSHNMMAQSDNNQERNYKTIVQKIFTK